MNRLIKRSSTKAGLPPGTLTYVGEQAREKTVIDLIDYDQTQLIDRRVETLDDCMKHINDSSVTWINITGVHDSNILQQLGDHFNVHPLVLEDIMHTDQRPKLEDHEEYIFIVMKMLYRGNDKNKSLVEQVSFLLGRNYVISLQETDGDVFETIRQRIRTGKGRIRKMGCDYLVYSLLDAIVDNYFVILESAADRIEQIQEIVAENAEPETLQTIHSLKREMIFLRKTLWPSREVVSSLEKSESTLIKKGMRPYLRDLYEHTIIIIDTVETLRDSLSSALDIYMTTVSNRMNEVMKVLTIIATIFIPLTFIAGIYGMNFENMPELKMKYGYFGVWGAMLVVTVLMLAYFKRKKWL